MDPFATAALLAIAQLSMTYMAIQPTPEEVHFKATQEFCKRLTQGVAQGYFACMARFAGRT